MPGRLKHNPPGVPQGAAALLNEQYLPKPPYRVLQELLSNEPPYPPSVPKSELHKIYS